MIKTISITLWIILLSLIASIAFYCIEIPEEKPYHGELCLRGVVYYYSGDDFELAISIKGKVIACGEGVPVKLEEIEQRAI